MSWTNQEIQSWEELRQEVLQRLNAMPLAKRPVSKWFSTVAPSNWPDGLSELGSNYQMALTVGEDARSPALRNWIAAVKEMVRDYPIMFDRCIRDGLDSETITSEPLLSCKLPTEKQAINRRLADIGDYIEETHSFKWKSPRLLDNELTEFELRFDILQFPNGIWRAYELLLDRWDAFVKVFKSYIPEFRDRAIGFFLAYADNPGIFLNEEDLKSFRDDKGEYSHEAIIRTLEGASITFATVCEEGIELVQVSAELHFEWEGEHCVEIEFDQAGNVVEEVWY